MGKTTILSRPLHLIQMIRNRRRYPLSLYRSVDRSNGALHAILLLIHRRLGDCT